jgi:hypothetical protein
MLIHPSTLDRIVARCRKHPENGGGPAFRFRVKRQGSHAVKYTWRMMAADLRDGDIMLALTKIGVRPSEAKLVAFRLSEANGGTQS